MPKKPRELLPDPVLSHDHGGLAFDRPKCLCMNNYSYVRKMTLTSVCDTSASLALTGDKAIELAEMFRLLGDPSRLRIVAATLAGPQPVGRMAESLGLSPSLVSHHLRLLRAARLVTAERRGKQIFYRVHDTHIRHVIADMIAHVNEEPEQA